ncbi:dihydroneopterin aldolase [Oscillospiraceae bacterium CM]|nr:dihydroneopterin aldolase [Oscillospiraceae bacterium CM]
MDKILLSNLVFFGHHGVLPEEQALGQPFELDVTLYMPLDKAGRSDDLADTADYAAVYAVIRDVVTKERYALIEALAEHICDGIFKAAPPVQRVSLRIKKPQAPIDGIFDYVGVEIERDRP